LKTFSRACDFKDLFLGGLRFCSAASFFTSSCASKNWPIKPDISLVIL